MSGPPSVAVVPFGAIVGGARRQRAGAWARQLSRRIVDRFAAETAIEVRPVFLVAMPETTGDAGYLVFGSTPDAKLAAEYARSLGATHALTGTYREKGSARRVEASLVSVASGDSGPFAHEIGDGQLQLAEPVLAAWLARSVDAHVQVDLEAPAAANETAYAALLEAMDAEVDATLLRESDRAAAQEALARAAGSYAAATAADPTSLVIEERILVMGAAAIESEQQASALPALEALAEARPRSWRAHYVLGEVRRTSGDSGGAAVAFEHSDALRPLRDADALTLARLYVASGAPAVAAAKLRRVIEGGGDAQLVAAARRLRLGLAQPAAEVDLERAGRLAIEGTATQLGEAETLARAVLAVDPDIWEAHFALGLVAERRGEALAAERAFSEVLRLFPGQPDADEQLRLLAERPGSRRS